METNVQYGELSKGGICGKYMEAYLYGPSLLHADLKGTYVGLHDRALTEPMQIDLALTLQKA
jgi:hypothetical protein